MKNILKKIYDFIPFKSTFFLGLKFVFKVPKNIYKHLSFKGVFKIHLDKQHQFKLMHHGYALENEIFWEGLEGCWEKVSIELWIKLCKNADVVFDVGANNGIYSLIAKTLNPNAEVYAFEPVKRIFDKLIENKELNNYQIHCIQKAASDRVGKIMIHDSIHSHSLKASIDAPEDADEQYVLTEIETCTISGILEERKLNKIDLMKIDVEGHEPSVLEGMGPYLHKFKPSMLIEIVSDEKASILEKILEGIPYLYFNIDEKKGIRQVEKLSKSDYYNFLLCLPEVAKEFNLIPSTN